MLGHHAGKAICNNPKTCRLLIYNIPSQPLLLLQGGWRNQIRGIIALELAYSPIAHAHHIRAPVLYLGGTHDRVLPLELLKQAADKTPDSRTFIVRVAFEGVGVQGVPHVALQVTSKGLQLNSLWRAAPGCVIDTSTIVHWAPVLGVSNRLCVWLLLTASSLVIALLLSGACFWPNHLHLTNRLLSCLPAALFSPGLFAWPQADAGHFSIHSGVRFSLVVEQMVDFLKHTNGMQHASTSSLEAAEHGSPRKDAEDSSANLGARKRDDVHEGWEAAGEAAAEL